MISDDELRRMRREHGRGAIPWNHRDKSDALEARHTENGEALAGAMGALGGAFGALAVPVLLIYFLPVIGVYLALAAGAISWFFMMFYWPRSGSLMLTVLTCCGLIYGIGSNADIKILWFEIGPIVSRDLPMWNGPGTWALAAVGVGPAVILLSYILALMGKFPPPFFEDESYIDREARGPSVYLPVSIVMMFTCLMPLIIFVPVILWSGMFGEHGFWPGAELTRSEVLRVLMDRPFDIFKAGFHAGIFWPGGFFASIGMLMLYAALSLSMVMSVFYVTMRRIADRDAREEKRAARKAKGSSLA